MTINIDRRVALVHDSQEGGDNQNLHPLEYFASEHSYVVLGEPGMGKTTELEKEAKREDGLLIPVRRFIHRNPENHPEWRTKPLFLDGLDEARTGTGNPKDIIHKVVSKLEDLNRPKFRISCRSNGWMGLNDLVEITSLFNGKSIPVLQLLPLNHDDIQQIVVNHGKNPEEFISLAQQHGLSSFLKNPQLLNVLVESFTNDVWRHGPTTVFEVACKELVKERNRGHNLSDISASFLDLDSILKGARKLCALLLISNKVGWSLGYAEDSQVLSVQEIKDSDATLLRAALNSSLFEGTPDCRTPIHRLFAEFLGAHYLHHQILDGLNIKRVFSLLLGSDGIPLPDLRGLASWLAALNQKTREILIDADPIAIAFNGDASNFSLGERRRVIKNLELKIDVNYLYISSASLGVLAGDHGICLLWELSSSHGRSDTRQTMISILLKEVIQMNSETIHNDLSVSEEQLQQTIGHLQKIIYDSSWNQQVRIKALIALNQLFTHSCKGNTTLRKILADLEENRLSDEQGRLYILILQFLYPNEIQPTEIWDYLFKIHPTQYLSFWVYLIDQSPQPQTCKLIDSLCDQSSEVIPKLCEYSLGDKVLQLLANGLNLYGDQLEIHELHRWFELVEIDGIYYSLVPSCSSDLRFSQRNDTSNWETFNWLREHEKVQLNLVEYDLILHESDIESDQMLGLKFVGIHPPAGFRLKCLVRATELCNTYPIVAERLALWSTTEQFPGWEPSVNDDKVEELVSDIPTLLAWNQKRLLDRDRHQQKEIELQKQREIRQSVIFEQRHEQLNRLRKQKNELSNGNCDPALMDELAHIYFSGMDHPRSNLESYMNGDQTLVQAALNGFRSLLLRDDLPDLDQIADLHENKRRSYFAYPYLAGIQQEEADTGQVLNRLDNSGIRRLLGFYFMADLPHQSPTWFDEVLIKHPEAVADCLVAIHKACVRSKILPNEHMYKMVDNSSYFSVAKIAVHQMFSVFPTRCSGYQLDSLKVVLWSVILSGSMSKDDVWDIASERLTRNKIDLNQKAIWLCTGLTAARNHCLPLLIDFLSTGQETRIYHVYNFLITSGGREFIIKDLPQWHSDELCLLIKAIGKHGQSISLNEGPYLIGNPPSLRPTISPLTPWIEELSRRGNDHAADAIDHLLIDPNLIPWKYEIRQAQELQAWNSRMAKRQEFSVGQIQDTLQNGPPASAADLLAITTDALEDLSDSIRNGQTNDWRQYWNWDHDTKKPKHPKDENDCRDIVLSDLKILLSQKEIDAQPEGIYADEKRSDIRISFRSNFSIPIEVKKNSHRKIWHGISEQLIPKYTRDPNCDGFGIYLVLWFGADQKYMKMLSPSGGVPKKPEDLKSMLMEQIFPTFNSRINVVVLDVSLMGKYCENSLAEFN